MIPEARKGTVCFIRDGDKVLLALIEYTNGERKWNGIGGFAEVGESLEEAVVREAAEETYIVLDKNKLRNVYKFGSSFELNVFVTDSWAGEIKIKEPTIKELKWFKFDEVPYSQMHAGNDEWLPKVLRSGDRIA